MAENRFSSSSVQLQPSKAMKNPTSRRRRGFTLIELLVVIAIIAVLAAAGFAAGNAAINRARKVTAQAAATSIESAVNSFYSDYGSLPDVGGNKVNTASGEGVELLNILLGLEGNGTNVQNSKGVRFLSVKEGKGNKGGLIYNTGGSTVKGLYDPWGNGFEVVLDTEYEEKLQVQLGSATQTLNGRRVAVYSVGADKKAGGNDDVKTW
jgi:prepilin-type N-terminal cleavage/methylation domain-containing protein